MASIGRPEANYSKYKIDSPGKKDARMAHDMVLIELNSRVATVTINRPEAHNALSSEVRKALAKAFVVLDEDPDVHAIVLTGTGVRSFSAGLDLKELGSDPDAMTRIVRYVSDENPMYAMDRCRKPIIGAINGVAITGGLELALGCDLLVGSSSARFADTHIRVGAIPAWGLSQRLSRLIGIMRAKEMSLTGAFVDASTALSWGLVNRVTSPEALLSTASDIAAAMAVYPVEQLATYKSLIDRGAAMALGDALELERAEALAASNGFALAI